MSNRTLLWDADACCLINWIFGVCFDSSVHFGKVVRVISGKIIKNMTEEKNRSVRVSGRFELSRVLVVEGKICSKWKENL